MWKNTGIPTFHQKQPKRRLTRFGSVSIALLPFPLPPSLPIVIEFPTLLPVVTFRKRTYRASMGTERRKFYYNNNLLGTVN